MARNPTYQPAAPSWVWKSIRQQCPSIISPSTQSHTHVISSWAGPPLSLRLPQCLCLHRSSAALVHISHKRIKWWQLLMPREAHQRKAVKTASIIHTHLEPLGYSNSFIATALVTSHNIAVIMIDTDHNEICSLFRLELSTSSRSD